MDENSKKWIDCNERLPPNDIYVLVAKLDKRKNVNMYFVRIACRMNKNWIDDHDGEILNPKYGIITHWMPLPDEPEKINE